MAIDEKYLDNLLKSLTENEQQSTDTQEPVSDVEQPFNNSDNDMDALASLLEADHISEEDASSTEKNDGADSEIDDWKSGLDDLIAQADAQVKEEADAADPKKQDESGSLDDMDADLKEIDGLLKNTDNEAAEDDILALLESFKDDNEESANNDSEEAFDIFAENASEEDKNAAENKEESDEEKPQTKIMFSKEISDKRKQKIKVKG